jgi:hypothetical protein
MENGGAPSFASGSSIMAAFRLFAGSMVLAATGVWHRNEA